MSSLGLEPVDDEDTITVNHSGGGLVQ